MKKLFLIFIALTLNISNTSAQKLETIQYSIKATVVIERDNEKELIPVPDTVVVVVPISKDSICLTNTKITPGRSSMPALVYQQIIENKIAPERASVPMGILQKEFLPYEKIYGGYVPPETTIFDLDIGRILCKEESGGVILSPDSQCVAIGGVKHPGGEGKPATLFIEGKKRAVYSLKFPEEVRLKRNDGNEEVILEYLTTNPALLQLDSLGKQTVNIGGLLLINENQAPGKYEGNIMVELSYYREPVVIIKKE